MVNNGQVEPEASTRPPASLGKREGRSPRDMVLSMAVLLVPIALVLVFYRVVLGGDAPVTIDPAPAIQQAQLSRAFPVLVPRGLPGDWHVTTAGFRTTADGATLRIGYVAPGDDSALLVQSSVPPATLLAAELGEDVEPTGSFRAANGVWRQYRARPGENALVLAEPGRTVVVVGTTGEENLEELASALSQP